MRTCIIEGTQTRHGYPPSGCCKSSPTAPECSTDMDMHSQRNPSQGLALVVNTLPSGCGGSSPPTLLCFTDTDTHSQRDLNLLTLVVDILHQGVVEAALLHQHVPQTLTHTAKGTQTYSPSWWTSSIWMWWKQPDCSSMPYSCWRRLGSGCGSRARR